MVTLCGVRKEHKAKNNPSVQLSSRIISTLLSWIIIGLVDTHMISNVDVDLMDHPRQCQQVRNKEREGKGGSVCDDRTSK